MATYKAKDFLLERTAGTTFDILIHVPDLFDMDQVTEARFQVKTPSGAVVLDKKLSSDDLLITGQDVYMKFDPEESLNKVGGRWELEVISDGDKIVIGKGLFKFLTRFKE